MTPYAVILCGGRGERFWPRSRRDMPKQFIRLFGDRSLTQRTSERMLPLCPLDRQLFVASDEFGPILRRQLKLAKRSLLFEPVGRNTAPAIGLAAAHVATREPSATMVVLPADHLITQQARFLASVRLALKLAQRGRLVTFGIPPTRPDTGYGYVQVGAKLAGRGALTAHEVRGFREKPGLAAAKRYLAAGDYLWNSGMFVWRADAILAAFERHLPAFHTELARYMKAVGTRRQASALKRLYDRAPATSIDYAIMEKADNIAAVRATFDWDDVGSWLALERHGKKDPAGNVVSGLCFHSGLNDCIVESDTGVTVVLGGRDLIVVRSGDAVLVAAKDRVADIKAVLKRMASDREAGKFL